MEGSAGAAFQLPEQPEDPEVLWVFLRAGVLCSLLGAGWAVNVSVFGRFRIDYAAALGLAKEELASPRQLSCVVLVLAMWLGMLRLLSLIQGPSPVALWAILVSYAVALGAVFICLPPSMARGLKWRGPLARALWRCAWPDAGKEVPFVEVLVADGLTSVARSFYDLAVGSCVAWDSVAALVTQQDGGILEGFRLREDGLLAANPRTPGPVPARLLVGETFQQCSRSPVPFVAWALPFIIRARQCLVSARCAPDSVSRDLHRMNAAKYLSALPIMLFALCHARAKVGGASWLLFEQDDYEALWAMAAVVNSVFSFCWDIVMDWGLMQPAPCRTFGLRPVLLFRSVWGFYHLAILCNLMGRTLWSLRWSPQATLFLGGFFLNSLQQVAEVLRRCLWNVLRVEWECIRRNIHRNDRHFRV